METDQQIYDFAIASMNNIEAEEANTRAQNTFQAGWNKAYNNFTERAQDSAAIGAQVFNNMKKQGHYHMFEMLMEQKEREKYLRDKYPAVNNAYKQYSLMLKLAESGEL